MYNFYTYQRLNWSGELSVQWRKCYVTVHVPSCEATSKVSTIVTLELAQNSLQRQYIFLHFLYDITKPKITIKKMQLRHHMMRSSNGNIFRVTGPLCGEFTGHRWIPHPKANDADLWCFHWSASWINGCANKREANDLRRHRVHCDGIVMKLDSFCLASSNDTIKYIMP